MRYHERTIAEIQQRINECDMHGSELRQLLIDMCDVVASLEAKLDDTSRRLATATRIKRKRKPPRRYVVVGEWSGNRPSQRRVCHMHVIPERKFDQYRAIKSIRLEDGTSLDIRLRPARVGEHVKEKHAFTEVIDACASQGKQGEVRVSDLNLGEGENAVHRLR